MLALQYHWHRNPVLHALQHNNLGVSASIRGHTARRPAEILPALRVARPIGGDIELKVQRLPGSPDLSEALGAWMIWVPN